MMYLQKVNVVNNANTHNPNVQQQVQAVIDAKRNVARGV